MQINWQLGIRNETTRLDILSTHVIQPYWRCNIFIFLL